MNFLTRTPYSAAERHKHSFSAPGLWAVCSLLMLVGGARYLLFLNQQKMPAISSEVMKTLNNFRSGHGSNLSCPVLPSFENGALKTWEKAFIAGLFLWMYALWFICYLRHCQRKFPERGVSLKGFMLQGWLWDRVRRWAKDSSAHNNKAWWGQPWFPMGSFKCRMFISWRLGTLVSLIMTMPQDL